jgi:hypothetical protein
MNDLSMCLDLVAVKLVYHKRVIHFVFPLGICKMYIILCIP